LPGTGQLPASDPRHRATLEHFLLLMNSINARPKAHNAYLREAWVSPHDNSIRVTFDRNIRIEPHFQPTAATEMQHPVQTYSEFVVLELKFTNAFPNWFNELVQRFNLMQASAAKYSGGVLMLGEQCFDAGSLFEVTPFLATDLTFRAEDWIDGEL
jgi:VTC domain